MSDETEGQDQTPTGDAQNAPSDPVGDAKAAVDAALGGRHDGPIRDAFHALINAIHGSK